MITYMMILNTYLVIRMLMVHGHYMTMIDLKTRLLFMNNILCSKDQSLLFNLKERTFGLVSISIDLIADRWECEYLNLLVF